MIKTLDDGTVLNTSTALEIGHFSNGRDRTDPQHASETLFKQKAVWFLRKRRDGKEQLTAVTPAQAATWLSQKNSIGELGYHFGERVKRTPVSVL